MEIRNEPADEGDRREALQARAELAGFVEFLRRRVPRAPVTAALLALNVAVYVLMVLSGVSALSPHPADVLAWGAVRGPEVFAGQYWRLFTCMFLHFGLLHIGFNMWVLKSVGPFVERLFGHAGFLTIYLVSGLVASAAGLAWSPIATAAGASGAIFGVVGGLLAALVVRPPEMPPAFAKALRGSLVQFVALNVVLGLAVPQIGLAAHLGGLVGGIGCGLALGPRGLLRPRPRGRWVARIAATTAAGLTLVVAATSWSAARFDPLLAARVGVVEAELASVETYDEAVQRHDAGELGDAELARILEREVLPPWRAMRARLEELAARDPGEVLDAFLRYAAHRERTWELHAELLRTGDEGLAPELRRERAAVERALAEVRALEAGGSSRP